VILLDLDSRKCVPEETLQQTFHLTEAESRVAARLAAGSGVEDLAAQLNLTKDTIRNHLKAVFAKTNTHRQGELVALLSNLLGCSNHAEL
jgi:DNA-binding CsgD family transcriptional regulator